MLWPFLSVSLAREAVHVHVEMKLDGAVNGSQLVECLASVHKALGSTSSIQ